MALAAQGGHRELVDFFISKGVNYWNDAMYHAVDGDHKDLVVFSSPKVSTIGI